MRVVVSWLTVLKTKTASWSSSNCLNSSSNETFSLMARFSPILACSMKTATRARYSNAVCSVTIICTTTKNITGATREKWRPAALCLCLRKIMAYCNVCNSEDSYWKYYTQICPFSIYSRNISSRRHYSHRHNANVSDIKCIKRLLTYLLTYLISIILFKKVNRGL